MDVLYSADLRLQSDRELVSCVSEKMVDDYAGGLSFMDFINKLSPAKKKFAISSHICRITPEYIFHHCHIL